MWMKTKIKIPKHLKPDEREALALEILEQIVERTKNGKDKDGDRFPSYSKSYKNSLNFKIGGKSSKVDLTLSGDMLADMQLLSHKSGELVIGFENGTESNAKAEGNIRGTYGQKTPRSDRARDFLGIDDKSLSRILADYPADDIDAKKEKVEELRAIYGKADAISARVFIEEIDED